MLTVEVNFLISEIEQKIKALMSNFARQPHYCKTDVTCR